MMEYTVAQLKRIYLFKVAVIFTIATFLINQGIEAMVIAEFIPVWALKIFTDSYSRSVSLYHDYRMGDHQ